MMETSTLIASSHWVAAWTRNDEFQKKPSSTSLKRNLSWQETWKTFSGKLVAQTRRSTTTTSVSCLMLVPKETQAEWVYTSPRTKAPLPSCGSPTLSTTWTNFSSNEQNVAMITQIIGKRCKWFALRRWPFSWCWRWRRRMCERPSLMRTSRLRRRWRSKEQCPLGRSRKARRTRGLVAWSEAPPCQKGSRLRTNQLVAWSERWSLRFPSPKSRKSGLKDGKGLSKWNKLRSKEEGLSKKLCQNANQEWIRWKIECLNTVTIKSNKWAWRRSSKSKWFNKLKLCEKTKWMRWTIDC